MKKIQVLVELDAKTKTVKTTGPVSEPALMIQILTAAINQVAQTVEPKKKRESDIVIPELKIQA